MPPPLLRSALAVSSFPITSQTLVFGLAGGDTKVREMSLARFCTLYYPVIYGYARNLGMKEPDAQDRAQDFFVEVVRDGLLQNYDPTRGTRLSSWLMTCFRNMVINQRAAASAFKRGGGREFVEFDPQHAEHSFRAAHLAHLAPEPTFDLMLAREIWLAAKAAVLCRCEAKGNGPLVRDLLPLSLMDRWPPRPMLTQDEMAVRHRTTSVKLKAFFNRTLKTWVRREFFNEAASACPGISVCDVDHLWALLCRYGDE